MLLFRLGNRVGHSSVCGLNPLVIVTLEESRGWWFRERVRDHPVRDALVEVKGEPKRV